MLPSRPCDRCIFPTTGAACDFLSVFAVISDLLAKLVVSYDLYPTQGVTEAYLVATFGTTALLVAPVVTHNLSETPNIANDFMSILRVTIGF